MLNIPVGQSTARPTVLGNSHKEMKHDNIKGCPLTSALPFHGPGCKFDLISDFEFFFIGKSLTYWPLVIRFSYVTWWRSGSCCGLTARRL